MGLGSIVGSWAMLWWGGVLTGCDPADNPVTTTAPPRDPSALQIRTISLRGDGVDAKTFQQDATLDRSDRVYFGSWEGARATAFIQFNLADAESLPPEGSSVTSALLRFRCVDGDGPTDDVPVVAIQVAPSDTGWTDEDPAWPGPALLETVSAGTTIDRCTDDDFDARAFPEIELDLPIEMVESWLAAHHDTTGPDESVNRGLAVRTATNAGLLSLASSENTFSAIVDSMELEAVAVPSLIVATDESTFPINAITADAYAVAPDSATLPCADPDDCLQIGKGAAWRTLFRFDLPELPEGSNIHRAIIRMSVLGHPRFDTDLSVDVLDLLSEWPAGAPVDSLVETSGRIWTQSTLAVGATRHDVPITDLVQAWYDETIENNGVLIRTALVDEGFTAVSFAASTHPDESLRPELQIKYTVPRGGRP